MPIKGLTDRVQPAFPELGILRKGGEKPNDNQPGKDLDHFRFTSERTEVVEAFKRTFKDKPTILTVYLPYPDVDANFAAWKEEWSASSLLHRCDGETMVLWLDAKTGKYRQDPQKCNGKCKQVGRLKVVVPELIKAGYIGFVTVLTTSLHDIISIQSSLLAAVAVSPSGLSGVPFLLWRQPVKISTPGGKDGKRARRVKSLLRIAPAGQWVQAQLAAAEKRAFAMLEAPVAPVLALPPVNHETGEVVEHAVPEEEDEEGQYTEAPPPADLFPDPEAPEPTAPDADELAAAQAVKDACAKVGRDFGKVQEWAGQHYNREWTDLSVAQLKELAAKVEKSGLQPKGA